jgi:benzoate-CoA ligase family protein
MWLFSGGTTGRPKAVLQTHASYANTAECYGKGVLGIQEDDVTMSVPKLYFGYATGSNLLFPFSVGASTVLFREHPTADVVFDRIARHRPTILVSVPKMVQMMVDDPRASERDLSSLRLATTAGEALPAELHRRWDEAFGVDLLDGLGTAEMWHIFLSNRPGDVRPGTLGKVVPGFEVEVRDDDGERVPDGQVGWLWVRGGSRAIGYWHRMRRTMEAFRGEWYVSGDMVSRDADGVFTYAGRADDMLKVSGKWLSPREVESCLLEHPAVEEVAVVGVRGDSGLTVPRACVVRRNGHASSDLAEELRAWVRSRLEPYKYPREVVFLDALPRTHLGKVDRAALRGVS